jgi:hypothetical protein
MAIRAGDVVFACGEVPGRNLGVDAVDGAADLVPGLRSATFG